MQEAPRHSVELEGRVGYRLYTFGPALYWAAVAASFFTLTRGSLLALLSLPLLLIVHHGSHETFHGSLIPGDWPAARQLNGLSGLIGCTLIGHNFILMRWSHMSHHACGRLEPEFTIDQSSRNRGLIGLMRYYIHLVGASSVMHEFTGYLLPCIPTCSRYLDGGGGDLIFRSWRFLLVQAIVLAMTVVLLLTGGWYFVLSRALFHVVWGLGQNVAHYGISARFEPGMEAAARSYRVNAAMSFLYFGANFRHAEHHAFPNIPGILLSHSRVAAAFQEIYGFELDYRHGMREYFKDMARQFKGPFGDENGRSWRASSK